MTSDNKHHRLLRLIDAGQEIAENPDQGDPVFMARELVQATLPHRNPPGNPIVWRRRNGKYTLTVRPYVIEDPDTGVDVPRYPFGVIPRLWLYWMVTEAKRTKSPRLKLGPTAADFMREIGLNPDGGKDRRRLWDQSERLFRSQISFDYAEEGHKKWLDMQVAPQGELWWDPKHPTQTALFESWIELGDKFYQAITAHPIPVDMRALRMLKNSPMALDFYGWLTYKTWQVIHHRDGKPLRVPWYGLAQQMGANYTGSSAQKNFKKFAKAAIEKIKVVYPGLNVNYVRGGLTIGIGRLAIPELEDNGQRVLL